LWGRNAGKTVQGTAAKRRGRAEQCQARAGGEGGAQRRAAHARTDLLLHDERVLRVQAIDGVGAHNRADGLLGRALAAPLADARQEHLHCRVARMALGDERCTLVLDDLLEHRLCLEHRHWSLFR